MSKYFKSTFSFDCSWCGETMDLIDDITKVRIEEDGGTTDVAYVCCSCLENLESEETVEWEDE